MNASQAKQIKLADLMARLGYEVKHIERGHTEYKYLSPFRAEVDPSFNVNLVKNQWFDFGEAKGGNTLDFAITYLAIQGRSSRVTDALEWLENTMGRPSPQSSKAGPGLFSFSQQASPISEPEKKAHNRDLEFVKASPLKSEVIFSYLESRKISRVIAFKYLKVVQYRNTSKNASERLYFGFGQQNNAGGWEVRSASDGKGRFKSALIERAITVHPGYAEQGRGAVSVFEGMLDHLSLLEMYGVQSLRNDAIVMNALSSYEQTKDYITETGYERINLFLDNNESGQKHVLKFQKDFGDLIVNHSPSFLPHIDLNDALRAGYSPSFETSRQTPEP